ncbi:aspergillopepsin [Penicillium odoratum]|uniref:aspergillopepsin n=1 Tax=Penicillium odoratum TaxID=1167516 RepID=UPI00254891CD|nr:aspergillopepsin [Penicillium odoratum]KAJ5777867.1 aspergillopepsin [Penicillium odoratum]
MKFSTAVISSTLLATALAAPLTTQRQARNEARRLARAEGRSVQRHSNPPYKPGTHDVIHFNETTNVEYSSNWAGAVLVGSGYTAVTGQFTVPTPKAPSSSSSGDYAASAWVGIDGDTWSEAILQTGVDFTVENGEVSYDAWYEWYPDYAYDFSGITISAGDVIKVTVDAKSKASGTATIENVTTGKTVTHTFSSGVEGDLGEVNAEWIVEDFEENDSLVAFANFGTVTFSDAQATDSGTTVGPSGATILDIEQNGEILTSVSTTSSSVTITYV